MNCEQYTLILRHDMVNGDERVQISEPLIMRYCINRYYAPSAGVILNSMLDDFKAEILKKIEQEGKT